VRLAELVAASERVAATGSRTEKETILAEALAALDPDEIAAGVALLAGGARQRQTGVGWAALRGLPAPATGPGTITVGEVDDALERLALVRGEGSRAERASLLEALFARATAVEQGFLRAILSDGVRQGASRAAVVGALARAAGVGREPLRRALALDPDLGAVAAIAFARGEAGLDAVELEVGRPLEPMLAGSAPDLAACARQGR
jgi:DNA ligase-1